MGQGLISTSLVMDNFNNELTRMVFYGGSFAFTTTSATVTVKVPDQFRRYHVFSIVWNGTPASDEIPSVQAPNADGTNSAEGSQGGYYVTITRTGASKTSGLAGTIYFRAVP